MDNTYIVFTGDHGLSVGHHGLLGKQNMYEHSLRVPSIVVGPNVPADEKRNQAMCLQDVMPTVLEWAGLEKPDYVDFHSLADIIKNPGETSLYPSIYGAYMNIHRMVISGEYKLIVYPEIDKILLYNLIADPQEMHNLADQAQYQEKGQEMILNLRGLMTDMVDPVNLSIRN